MTPGARLAAHKAAKAARKASDRGRTGDKMQVAASKRAALLRTWVRTNRMALLIGVVVAVLALGGLYGWNSMRESNETAAAGLLWKAVETETAAIVPAGEANEDDEERPSKAPRSARITFPTTKARTEKALEAFRAVVRTHGDSRAAPWARIGEARVLLSMEKPADARRAFEAALRLTDDQPALRARALEGIAYTYEAEEKWDEALRRYEELARIDRDTYGRIARYHQGRLKMARGDLAGAKQVLGALLEELKSSDAEAGGGSQMPYTRTQVELRMTALDPSLVPRGGAGPGGPGGGFEDFGGGAFGIRPGGGGAGGLNQEEIQRLIERLRAQAATKSGGGPPGLPALGTTPAPVPPGAGQ